MSRIVKIAISLPEETLQVADRACRLRGESRSAFFRHAVESFIAHQRQREEIERYVGGYREQPETDDELAAAQRSSVELLGPDPWE